MNNSTAFSTTRLLLLWAGTFLYLSAYGQGGFSTLYQEGLGTSSILYDHPYTLTAAQTSSANGTLDILFMKIDQNGNLIDSAVYSEDTQTVYAGLQNCMIRSGNHYIVCGRRSNLPKYEGMLLKLDTNLTIVDSVFFQIGSEWTSAISVSRAKNNDLLVAGTIYWMDSVIMRRRKGFLAARFDADFNPKWIKRFHTPSVNGKVVEQQAHNVMEDSKGNIWLGGYRLAQLQDNGSDALVIALDSVGNKILEKVLGNPALSEGIATVVEAPDSNYFIATIIGDNLVDLGNNPQSRCKLRVLEMDIGGTILWDKAYGSPLALNYISNCEKTKDGYLSSGYYLDWDRDFTQRDAFYRSFSFKTNFNGDSIWYREYIAGSIHSDWNRLFDLSVTPDGGFVAGGHFSSDVSPLTGQAGSHVWIIKADSLGCVVPRCQYVSLPESEPKTSINLYPNPTHGSFYLQGLQGKTLSLRVYDASGREVLYRESISEGEAIHLKNQSAGLYHIQLLQNGYEIHQQRIILQP